MNNIVLYRSEVLEKNLSPSFAEFEVGTWADWNKDSLLSFDIFVISEISEILIFRIMILMEVMISLALR
jgi:hypothetical protein